MKYLTFVKSFYWNGFTLKPVTRPHEINQKYNQYAQNIT